MIRMEVSKISKYRKLVKEDRILIAQWKIRGLKSQVAKWLGRLKLDYHNEFREIDRIGNYLPIHLQIWQ